MGDEMSIGRRGFLGAFAGAVVAGPEIAKAGTAPLGRMVPLKLAMDTAPMQAMIGELAGEARELQALSAAIQPFGYDGGRNYIYRTGHPDIDCLRSISGTYRHFMERRRGD